MINGFILLLTTKLLKKMKKTSLFSVMAIFALVSLSSCDKEVVSSPIYVNKLPQANISGYVTAEMNLQTAGAEYVPVGTQLFVEVSYNGLNPSATGSWKDTVTVSATGEYHLAVPSSGSGVTVSITPVSFEADQVQAYGAFFPKVKKIYAAAKTQFTITAGSNVTGKNFSYTPADLPTFTDKVSVTGKVQANLDAAIVGLESVPNGTVINFTSPGFWKDSVVVQNGTYTIIVPKSALISWSAKFKYNKNTSIWNANTNKLTFDNTKSYEYSMTGSSTFSSVTTDYNLSAGEGTIVDLTPTIVTVSGSAKADLDLSVAGTENMPDGTPINFYTSDNSWAGIATVSNGSYSINMPRNTQIYYTCSFTATQRTATGGNTPNKSYYVSSSFYSTTNSTLTQQNITAN